ncbi:hypothetical protein C0Q70_07803 [Pomacea canaliculata]|uniref:Uncharacterized protein n=1 Tax=Pomacea canaliculata TaxID=400727 RepID=A0A2T7PG26_POMCA|nr:hypothetical protein C0Q70_07803 [Pomacea canaliculata]
MQSQFSALGALHVLQGILFWALLQRCHAFQLDGTNKSYAKFPAWEPCLNGSFSFDFMTGQPYALLVYLDYGGIHFLELKLIRGSVQLRANFGEGTVTMLAGENLDDSRWHAVEVRQDNERTVLTVDGITHVKSAPGKMADFRDVTSKEAFMFVGGLPVEYESRLNILAVASVVFEPRFKGSIRNLFYRFCGREQHRPEIIDSGGLLSVGVELCERGNPCLNGGVCLTTNSGLVCDCARTEFKGERCDLEKIPSDATFFGAQYFTYNLSGQGDGLVSNRDSISLDFRTKHPDGLLFYTGNVKDYLNIAIRDGAIILAINLGSGSLEREIRPSGPRFDDNLWHQVVVRREAREISLEVDGIYQEKGSTTGNFKLLSSKALYVAGSPDTANLPGSRVNANFRGCMRKVRYRADSVELDLTELARAEHALLKVIGGVIFDKCQELVDSRPITFTTPESYLTIPVWSAGPERGSLAFQFQTVEQHGVLLYSTGAASGNPDVFALELLDGYLHLVINMGSEPIRLKASRQPVTDGSPHMVYFEYAANRGYISVDGQKETFSTFSHLDRFDLQGSFFIGGISKTAEEIPLPTEMWAGTLGYGYVGCLQDMVVDGGRVDLVRAAQIQGVAGVAEYCQAMEPHCTSRPCMHQGQCTEGWNRFTCDCRATGFIDSVCQTAAATLRFDGKQFVKVTVPEESHTQAEDISLRFRTMHPNGLLFMTTSERAEDKMELYLKSGSIFLGVDVGSGHKVLSVGHSLNDDRWHTAYIKRRAQTVELKIDVQRPVTGRHSPCDSFVFQSLHLTKTFLCNRAPPCDLAFLTEISRRAAELEFRRVNIGDVLQDDNKSNAFSGFIGSMQQFIFNRNQFFDMARSEKIEVTAKLSTNGHVMHDPVTFKSTDAYAVLPRLQIHDKFSISFQLKTTETDGLLMYNPGRGQDFFAMEMTGGFLYYVYNMGAGTQRIRANVNEKLSDNKWHEVQLLRTETYKQLLRVDDKTPTVDDLSGSSAIHFDLQGHLYIGGVRKTMYHTLPKKVEARFGFMGCIDSLYLNGYMANIHRDANPIHESVVDGCQAPASQCQNDSCANGGRCVQQWNSFSCDCDMTSFSGPTCQAVESTTYRFGPGYGLIKFAHPAENLPSTNRENLALGFKTRSSDAVLVRIDSATYDDYIELELNKGNIVAVYNMGTMDYPIGEMFDKVNDGKYHVVRFTRSGPNSTIQVDNLMMQTKMPRGQQAHTFNNQAFVYIGGKQEKNKTVSRPFQGTISGLVLNGIKILDLARQGDKRISLEGNVTHQIVHSISIQKQTTPQNGVTDEIIFSGGGPCPYDDEDDCTATGSGTDDDIITPSVIIKTTPPPPTTTTSDKRLCKEENCPHSASELEQPTEDIYVSTPEQPKEEVSEKPTGDTNKTLSSGGSSGLNLGLIIGIAVSVLVAVVILCIALYKFRSRDEGTYKVDESQNFTSLDSKKSQQGNGTLLSSSDTGKRGGKKKDVKEWYV